VATRVVGLIPARGGSKGIPRKNLQKFGDSNLLSHKISQTRNAGIKEIFVSTEDLEIKKTAISSGANVIDRPMEFATDTSSTDEVVNHAQPQLSLKPQDILVLLQVTSPLLLTSSINRCVDKLTSNNHLQCVFTIYNSHPFIWKNSKVSQDIWEPQNHSRTFRPRRQDIGMEGCETGGCYAIRVEGLLEQGVRYPAPSSTVSVNYLESLDIDNLEDLKTAQFIYQVYADMFRNHGRGEYDR
jgi:N-acylneuraminate cytidylyltransferase